MTDPDKPQPPSTLLAEVKLAVAQMWERRKKMD